MHIRRIAAVGAVCLVIMAAGACGAAPSATSGLSCQAVGGIATVVPGVGSTAGPQDIQFTRDGGLALCDDHGAFGISSGNFVTPLTVHFDSLGCSSPDGTEGEGNGTIRWQNWRESGITVDATLIGPSTIQMTMFVTSGPFDGLSANLTLRAQGLTGNCTVPITKGLVGGGKIDFTVSPSIGDPSSGVF
jgi:hypothetical protein